MNSLDKPFRRPILLCKMPDVPPVTPNSQLPLYAQNPGAGTTPPGICYWDQPFKATKTVVKIARLVKGPKMRMPKRKRYF